MDMRGSARRACAVVTEVAEAEVVVNWIIVGASDKTGVGGQRGPSPGDTVDLSVHESCSRVVENYNETACAVRSILP
jgi:hypothetical protein